MNAANVIKLESLLQSEFDRAIVELQYRREFVSIFLCIVRVLTSQKSVKIGCQTQTAPITRAHGNKIT